MSLKSVIVCGALLGLLTGVSFAQRRVTPIGTTTPGARVPNAVRGGDLAPTPTLPAQTGISSHTPNTTVAPNTTTPPTAKTVAPNVPTMPDRVIAPNTRDISPHTTTLPNF
jgi:hypothetical protein